MLTKKQFIRLVSMGLILSGGLLYAGSSAAKIPKNSWPQQQENRVKTGEKVLNYKEGEVIVKFKKNVGISHAKGMINSLSMDVAKEFKTLSKAKKQAYLLVRSKSLSTEELIAKLKADPNVEYVEPNHLYKPDATPNDPMFDQLWGQHNTGQFVNGTSGTSDADMDVSEAWETSTGSSDVVIAVIDTGVDYLHEDLAANMWKNTNEIPDNGIDDDGNGYVDDVYGIDAANDTGDPMDVVAEDGGHGTHVAGTIAAVGDNGKGVVGASWNAKIMALKFLSTGGGYSTDAIECLEYVIAQKNAGVNIVATNNSWGGGDFSQTLKDTIEATNNLGILFTAAAGNDEVDNDATPHYPSSYDLPGIISVAATDQDDELVSTPKHYYGSNYGASSVDLAAPGINILSSIPKQYTPKSGDIFFDDMESGMGKWITGGTNDYWAISTDQEIFDNPSFPVPSPTHFLSDSPSMDYLNNTNSWIMVANDIDLSAYTDQEVYIGFGAAWAMFDAGDHSYVEVSGDSGSTWTQLEDFTDAGYYWKNPYIYIIPNNVKTANFRIRFHLQTDSGGQWDGWLIDDVGIGTEASSRYAYYGGTSMATPQVSGAIAILASIYGGDSIASRKARILDSVDTHASLNGKVVTGGRLNLKSAIDTGATETCPEDEHHIQGTLICLPGTAVPPPELSDSPCGVGMRMTQGTEECVSADEVAPPGAYLPSCPEGEQAVQGTDQCEVVPG